MMHFVFKLYQVIALSLDVYYDKPADVVKDGGTFTIIVVLHTSFGFIFCIDYYNRLPYYNAKVSEIYCFCVYCYFWIDFVFLLCHMANMSQLTDNVMYIILVGLVFFLYIVKKFRETFYRSLIIREIDEISNEIHLDVRFRYLMSIAKNAKKDKHDELLLTSIIKVHTEECVNIHCICKNRA
jgi:hypothetical protein